MSSFSQRVRLRSVAVQPGHSALTRTPVLAHSTASVRVSEISAALEAPYCAMAGVADNPATLATLITEPVRRSNRCGAAACSTCTAESTLSRITFAQPAKRSCGNGTITPLPPTLLTITSSSPSPSIAPATTSCAACSSVTSPGSTTAAPTSSAVFRSCSAPRLLTATFAPARTNAAAIAAPMPREAPVTRAVFQVRSNTPPTLPRRAAAASVARRRAGPPHLHPAPVAGAPAGGVPVPALAGLRVGHRPGDDVRRHRPDHLVAARAPVWLRARAAGDPADLVVLPPPLLDRVHPGQATPWRPPYPRPNRPLWSVRAAARSPSGCGRGGRRRRRCGSPPAAPRTRHPGTRCRPRFRPPGPR